MTTRITLRPLALEAAPPPRVTPPGDTPSGDALRLAGGPLRFAACEAVARELAPEGIRELARARLAPKDASDWAARYTSDGAEQVRRQIAALSAPRAPFAGLSLTRPRLMGILNVTPDSFSDGGDRFDAGRAVADGFAMIEAGAGILDVGGESTRPRAEPVEEVEEIRRILPVVRALAGGGALVSIDTRRARVMAAALEAGARIVNDVTALTGDPHGLSLIAEAGASVVLMHMQGEPRTMQIDPIYADVPLDIYDYLSERVAACEAAGIPRDRIAIDPGIGFGKALAHNLRVLDHLAVLHGIGCPLVLGVSRKSFLAKIVPGVPPKARLPGSLAANLAGLARGVQILRVHDVPETAQAVTVWEAIQGYPEG